MTTVPAVPLRETVAPATSTRTYSTLNGTPWLAQKRSQNFTHWSALGLRPWCTCSAVTRFASARCRARTSSSTVESRPPDNPTQIFAFGGKACAMRAPTSLAMEIDSMRPFLFGDFFEFPVVHPALLSPLEQLVG